MATQAPLPARGSLTEITLPELLLRLYKDRFCGRVELSRGRTQKAFVLLDGAPISSESNVFAERLTGVLEQAGTLTRVDRDRVDAHVAREKCQEGVALLKLELVEPKALFLGLREQLRHRMIEAFGWADGNFLLAPSEGSSDAVQPFRADPYALVQEGLQTHWSVDRLLAGLKHRMNAYPRPGKALGEASRRLTLDAAVGRMIAGLNGRQKLGTLACGAGSSPAIVAALWVLDAIGALAYADTPSRSESESDEAADIEIEIRGAGDADAAVAPVAANPIAAVMAPQTGSAEGAALCAEILEKRVRLKEMNHYELLGVPADAPHAAIRKAYFKAAKRYHPDAIGRLGVAEAKTAAGEIFTRIALANETLSDADRRKDYDKKLSGGPAEVDITTLAQAETFYRKGEILIRMGDFRGAVEYLKNAVDLYPQEAAYQSDLGWAYYKKQPQERERAREHVRRALELDPGNSVAQFRIGVIEK